MLTAALLVLVGGGLFAALSNSSTGTGPPLVGQTNRPAPRFSLPDVVRTNRTVSLADFRGHGVVVNFWASWCIPCRTEMPLLESAFRSGHGRVVFLGIDTNDTRSAATAFLAQVHATYPTAFDPHGQVATAYLLFGLPTTVFISAKGKIVGRHIGQLDGATLQAALQTAFGGTGTA